MVDIIGFWAGVTWYSLFPLAVLVGLLTRWLLSVAKENAPTIPLELRAGSRYSWSTWNEKLYPKWAHNIYYYTCGILGFEGVFVLRVLSIWPVITAVMVVMGACSIDGQEANWVEAIAHLSNKHATFMGWFVLGAGSLWFFTSGIQKVIRLIGLYQIHEMKEERKNELHS